MILHGQQYNLAFLPGQWYTRDLGSLVEALPAGFETAESADSQ